MKTTILTAFTVGSLLALAGPSAAQVMVPSDEATRDQLAARLGLEPAGYSLPELAAMTARIEGADSDAEKQRLLEEFRDGEAGPAPSRSEVRAQLAASLGVDPDDYSLAELVKMHDSGG